jgi:response regulator NasT
MRAAPIRVWLADDPPGLERPLRQLADGSAGELLLLGAGAFVPDYAALLRARLPDVLVLRASAWPEGPWTEETLAVGCGVLIVADAADEERFRAAAETQPVVFVPPAPSPEALRLGLLGARCAGLRQAHWHGEVERLRQRLADRIVIERAKGVLCQRLGISEEEAYNRLRVLSRRQRRQVRDIARSLLDTEMLLTAEGNGSPGAENRGGDDESATPL